MTERKRVMGGVRFDDLLLALRSSLTAAQVALKKRKDESACVTGGVDETGVTRAPVLSFAIPKAGAAGDEYETLTLPLSSFHDRDRPRISTLSLEFECELKEKKLSVFSGDRGMVMKIRKSSGAHGGKRRKVRIVFHGAERPFGEVRVDGELLMVIPPTEGTGGHRIEVVGKWPFFRALTDLWRKLRGPRDFVLTELQAERIREILDQPEHGDVSRLNRETAG